MYSQADLGPNFLWILGDFHYKQHPWMSALFQVRHELKMDELHLDPSARLRLEAVFSFVLTLATSPHFLEHRRFHDFPPVKYQSAPYPGTVYVQLCLERVLFVLVTDQ